MQENEQKKLLFGTIDTWLTWKLCGAHVTDPSNASRTLLYNIHSNEWDEELLELLHSRICLPNVVDNAGEVGQTKGLAFARWDSSIWFLEINNLHCWASLFRKGEAKSTYGTGAFVLMNTGEKAVRSQNGLLTTIAWRLNGETVYALEGSAFVVSATYSGSEITWVLFQRRQK